MLLDELDVGEFWVDAAAARSQWRSASGQSTVCCSGAHAKTAGGRAPLAGASDPGAPWPD
jgi:hypothetical protein